MKSVISNKTLLIVATVALIIVFILWKQKRGENSNVSVFANSNVIRKSIELASENYPPELPSEQAAGVGNASAVPIDADKAKALIAEFNLKNPNITQRSGYAASIIKNLCDNGYSLEAFKIIEPGYGQVRDWQLTAFFEHAKLSDEELRSIIQGMEYESAAINGYFSRFNPDQMSEILSSGEMRSFMSSAGIDGKGISVALALSIQNRLFSANDLEKEALLQTTGNLLNDKLVDPQDLMLILNHPAVGDSFDKWRILSRVNFDEITFNNTIEQRNAVLSNMIQRDATKTITEVLNSSDSNIRQVINQWTTLDSKGAAEWYQKNQGNLDVKQNGAITSEFALLAAKSLDFATAKQWIDKIKDPEVKSKTTEMFQDRYVNNQKEMQVNGP